MAVIKKNRSLGTPEVSTSSLPDIIFTLLFFFMVSAKVKDSTLKIRHNMPRAVDTKKLTSDDKVSTIHIGNPLPQYQSVYGTEPVIQLNDQIAEIGDVQEWILIQRQAVPYASRPKFLVNIKADGDVPYKMIDELKVELRKANALRINYDAKTLTYE